MEHTFVLQPGSWVSEGTCWLPAYGGRHCRGRTTVAHGAGSWELRVATTVDTDAPTTFESVLEVDPLRDRAGSLRYRARNRTVGTLEGVFRFVDDRIMSVAGAEGIRTLETLRMIDDDHYEANGALVLAGVLRRRWTTTLVRSR